MPQRLIPEAFARRMGEAFGEAGQRWAAGLPKLIDSVAADWGLTVGAPFQLSYNYVAPATGPKGDPVVLKLGCPRPEFEAELRALQIYAGRGSVRLLAHNLDRGAMLLERLWPGQTLDTLADDAAATTIAAQVMAQLWQTPPTSHTFPTTDKWMQGLARLRAAYAGGTGPFPLELVDRAECLNAALHASAAPAVVLHGDLHHANILSAERAPWLAIDPQGVVGEPAYETGALLRNPMPQVYEWPDLADRTARRVQILAESLGIERQRIVGWGLAQAVLSSWWTLEDHGRFDEPALRLAHVLLPMT